MLHAILHTYMLHQDFSRMNRQFLSSNWGLGFTRSLICSSILPVQIFHSTNQYSLIIDKLCIDRNFAKWYNGFRIRSISERSEADKQMRENLIKRASGAFSLAMKSNNCLRILVLTQECVSSLEYVSPLGERVPNRLMLLAPPTLGYAHTKSCAYHHVFKSIESLDGDCGMDRCHYAVPFKGILIRSTPENIRLKETNYKKAKMEGGLSRMTNYYRE